MLFIDLDRFKPINDSLGHDVGDQLLVMVAQRLREAIRESDIACRFGGDEFIVLLRLLNAPEQVALVTEKILERLTAPFLLNQQEVSIGASIGIGLYPLDSQHDTDLIRFADLAMYQAKSDGGNGYHFYSEQLATAAHHRSVFENNLRQAVSSNQLALHFQPIIDLSSGEIALIEVLVRWQQQELLYPHQFLPMIETTDLILELDHWVLQQTCTAYAQWPINQDMQISINLSARHFRESTGIMTSLQKYLRESGLAPQQLVLEITESELFQVSSSLIRLLNGVRKLGIRIAIDNFGTGYSSLHELKDLPIDILKIDRSFLQDVPVHSKSTDVLAAIISLAKSLRLQVIAEGVESEQQLNWLKQHQCDYAQGYFLARPAAQPIFSLT